jgi:hypothetical protein
MTPFGSATVTTVRDRTPNLDDYRSRSVLWCQSLLSTCLSLTSLDPDSDMASGISELNNEFLTVSRLTVVSQCGCSCTKHSYPFAVEFSTDLLGYHRNTVMHLYVISW